MVRLSGREKVCALSAAALLSGAAGSCGPPSAYEQIDAGPPDEPWVPTGAPELVIEAMLVDFGDVVAGGTGAPETFTVTNVGDLQSSAISAFLDGDGALEFAMVANTCAGMRLAPDDECDITVEFAPERSGRAMATLDLTDGDVRTSAILQGRGLPPAGLAISPTPVNFGRAGVGMVSRAQTFTVENTGRAPTGTLMNTLTGADAAEFSISGSTCAGVLLAGGATCTISVLWTAGTPGDKFATLEVTDGTLVTSSTLTATALAP